VQAATTEHFLVDFLTEKIGVGAGQATQILAEFRAWRDQAGGNQDD
jgi:hypothetical protein